VRLSGEGGDGKATIVHELGHHLEESNSAVLKAVRSYRAAACAGGKILPLGKQYEPDEKYLARTDGKKWINNYIGKVYDSGHTEVTSMGLELYSTKPLELARKDPDLFKLIANVARGTYKS
jgi:hypothetical protein